MNYFYIFFLSTFLVFLYRKLALKAGILDKPNHRTSHEQITPRGGGIIFVMLWLVQVILNYAQHKISFPLMEIFVLPVSLVALVSFIDDNFPLRKRYRLISHFIAASLVIYFFNRIGAPIASEASGVIRLIALTMMLFYIVWSINLFNFMDGLDGLASVQSIFIFFISGCLLFYFHVNELASLSCLLAFSVLGFLVWNWPNAKIFMGDVGSTSLGLIVAVFTLLALKQENSISIVIYFMLYIPFIFDATVTLLRRVLSGEKWYEAHNQHAFQRLYQSGWSHRKVLVGLIILNSISAILVICAVLYPKFLYSFFMLDLIVVSYVYYVIECINPFKKT